MLYFFHMQRRISPISLTLAGAVLLFAGFGCKPILDAQVARQNQVESRWVLEEPKFGFEWLANYNGTATVTMRTQATEPAPVVAITLSGPGVVGEKTVVKTADKDGSVRLYWPINRVGHYTFEGTVSFNGTIVEGFEGEGDTY